MLFGPVGGSRSTICEITGDGKVDVDSGSDEAQSLLLEPWPPLEKALVVEKGMNRESDEREILDPVLVCLRKKHVKHQARLPSPNPHKIEVGV